MIISQQRKQKLQLTGFLITLHEWESQLELMKNVVNNIPSFKPFVIFEALTKGKSDHITQYTLTAFLANNGLEATPSTVRLLISLFDSSFEGKLDINSFFKLILSRDFPEEKFNESRYEIEELENPKLTPEVEFGLSRFLHKALGFLEDMKENPEFVIALCEDSNLFSRIDVLKEGIITYQNLKIFFETCKVRLRDEDIIAILRVIDINSDGKVSFEDFEIFADILRTGLGIKRLPPPVRRSRKVCHSHRLLGYPKESYGLHSMPSRHTMMPGNLYPRYDDEFNFEERMEPVAAAFNPNRSNRRKRRDRGFKRHISSPMKPDNVTPVDQSSRKFTRHDSPGYSTIDSLQPSGRLLNRRVSSKEDLEKFARRAHNRVNSLGDTRLAHTQLQRIREQSPEGSVSRQRFNRMNYFDYNDGSLIHLNRTALSLERRYAPERGHYTHSQPILSRMGRQASGSTLTPLNSIMASQQQKGSHQGSRREPMGHLDSRAPPEHIQESLEVQQRYHHYQHHQLVYGHGKRKSSLKNPPNNPSVHIESRRGSTPTTIHGETPPPSSQQKKNLIRRGNPEKQQKKPKVTRLRSGGSIRVHGNNSVRIEILAGDTSSTNPSEASSRNLNQVEYLEGSKMIKTIEKKEVVEPPTRYVLKRNRPKPENVESKEFSTMGFEGEAEPQNEKEGQKESVGDEKNTITFSVTSNSRVFAPTNTIQIEPQRTLNKVKQSAITQFGRKSDNQSEWPRKAKTSHQLDPQSFKISSRRGSRQSVTSMSAFRPSADENQKNLSNLAYKYSQQARRALIKEPFDSHIEEEGDLKESYFVKKTEPQEVKEVELRQSDLKTPQRGIKNHQFGRKSSVEDGSQPSTPSLQNTPMHPQNDNISNTSSRNTHPDLETASFSKTGKAKVSRINIDKAIDRNRLGGGEGLTDRSMSNPDNNGTSRCRVESSRFMKGELRFKQDGDEDRLEPDQGEISCVVEKSHEEPTEKKLSQNPSNERIRTITIDKSDKKSGLIKTSNLSSFIEFKRRRESLESLHSSKLKLPLFGIKNKSAASDIITSRRSWVDSTERADEERIKSRKLPTNITRMKRLSRSRSIKANYTRSKSRRSVTGSKSKKAKSRSRSKSKSKKKKRRRPLKRKITPLKRRLNGTYSCKTRTKKPANRSRSRQRRHSSPPKINQSRRSSRGSRLGKKGLTKTQKRQLSKKKAPSTVKQSNKTPKKITKRKNSAIQESKILLPKFFSSKIRIDISHLPPDCEVPSSIAKIAPIFHSFMNIERTVEFSRRQLSVRPDFNVKDLFYVLDSGKKKYLSCRNFQVLLKELKMTTKITKECVRELFDFYDLDEDRCFSFSEFAQLLCPRDPDHRRLLKNRRPKKNLKTVKVTKLFTKETRMTLKNVLYNLFERIRLNKEIKQSYEFQDKELTVIFDILDKDVDRKIGMGELESFMELSGISPSEDELQLLFEKLDVDHDGIITIKNFIEFFRI